MKSPDGWTKKFKGNPQRGGAWIYTNPNVAQAIVQNHLGISFNGKAYSTLREAMKIAETGREFKD